MHTVAFQVSFCKHTVHLTSKTFTSKTQVQDSPILQTPFPVNVTAIVSSIGWRANRKWTLHAEQTGFQINRHNAREKGSSSSWGQSCIEYRWPEGGRNRPSRGLKTSTTGYKHIRFLTVLQLKFTRKHISDLAKILLQSTNFKEWRKCTPV